MGYQCRLPPKDDWLAQVNALNVAFAQDRIWIAPNCVFTIQSLVSGTFNKNRTDFERTHALGHCDALAALVYGYRCVDKTDPYPASARNSQFFSKADYLPAPEVELAGKLTKQGGFTQKGIKRFG
jgi:hypothetical protein